MQRISIISLLFLLCVSGAAWADSEPDAALPGAVPAQADAREAAAESSASAPAAKPARRARIDRSGDARKGKASYYSRKFYGKKMADGTRMDPDSLTAASKTLPLGTKAMVTNLRNGKSAVVEITDRGPHVKGRIIDVSPKVARLLDMHKDGVAPVEVTPIELPERSGSLRTGSAADVPLASNDG